MIIYELIKTINPTLLRGNKNWFPLFIKSFILDSLQLHLQVKIHNVMLIIYVLCNHLVNSHTLSLIKQEKKPFVWIIGFCLDKGKNGPKGLLQLQQCVNVCMGTQISKRITEKSERP